MFLSTKLIVIDDDKYLTDVSFTHGKIVCFGSLEFIPDHFDSLSLSDKGNVSGTMFVGMAHSGSPALHTILEDSADEGDTTSSRGRNSGFPISQGCNMVTLYLPITTTPPSEGTPMPLAITTVPL
jgi:hypothetical protein